MLSTDAAHIIPAVVYQPVGRDDRHVAPLASVGQSVGRSIGRSGGTIDMWRPWPRSVGRSAGQARRSTHGVTTTRCLSSIVSGLIFLHQTGVGCVVVIWPRTFSHQFVMEREFGFGGGEEEIIVATRPPRKKGERTIAPRPPPEQPLGDVQEV
jgi:hypothetical protein